MATAFGAYLALVLAGALLATTLFFATVRRSEHATLSTSIATTVRRSVDSVSFAGNHHLRKLLQDIVADDPMVAYIRVVTDDGVIVADDTGQPTRREAAAKDAQRRDQLKTQSQHTQEVTFGKERVLEVSVVETTGFVSKPHIIRIGVRRPLTTERVASELAPLVALWLLIALVSLPVVRAVSARIGAPAKDLANMFAGIMDRAPLFVVVGNGTSARAASRAFTDWADLVGDDDAPLPQLFDDDVPLGLSHTLQLHMMGQETTLEGIRFDVGLKDEQCYIGLDVTRERELQEQLRQAQKMESVGQLAGGVAHDFNNLLTVINGVAGLELRNPDVDKELQESFDVILQAGKRAADLTHKLLIFSRQHVQQLRPVHLGEVVDELVPMLERLVPETLRIDVEHAAPAPAVMADPGQLEQVLVNLVVNARDAQNGKGWVHIGIDVAGPPSQATSNLDVEQWVHLHVSDGGPGIPDDVMPRLFDPFFTTKEVGQGTGLGLSTAFGIARQSGGALWASRPPEGGARFTLALPATSAQTDLPLTTTTEATRGRGRTLLVEDEAVVRQTLARLLSAAGFDVTVAKSAHDAMTLLCAEKQSFDVMLTDIVMPEMSGTELVAQLVDKGCALPVVYVSGYSPSEVQREAQLQDAVVVQKPVTLASLLDGVRRVAPQLLVVDDDDDDDAAA